MPGQVIKFDLHLQPELTEQEVQDLAVGSDTNLDGVIDWHEFLAALLPRLTTIFNNRGGSDWVALTCEYGQEGEYLYW